VIPGQHAERCDFGMELNLEILHMLSLMLRNGLDALPELLGISSGLFRVR
jgi:hypothetical protein